MASVFFQEALLPHGFERNVRVAIADGVIERIEAGATPIAGEERHAIGLAGMPNLHSHAFQRGMAGLAEVRGPQSDSFWTWREVMYRFALGLEPEDVEAVAAQLYVEMLEAGFTRVGEFHYLHHDRDGKPYADPAEMSARIAAASAQTGIGLTLLPVFYAHGGFGGKPPNDGQRRFVNDLDRFGRLVEQSRVALSGLEDARLGVAPHSLRAVTAAELANLVPLAQGGPIHIHVAEQSKEVEDCVSWSGARPVEWLLAHAPVDRRWCLVHATHMTREETRAVASAGAVAGLCPITEANLGDGTFNASEFIEYGGEFGIGSDSHVFIGVADELRQLEYSQRLRHRARNVMAQEEGRSTGRSLYQGALVGGTRALGEAKFGLAEGARADFLSLDAEHPALVGRAGDALLDAFIFSAPGSIVDCVWRAGEKLVQGGRHRRREAILARFRAAMGRLLA
ncbi:MAG: formimidoylglutamate deiminase [Hyphomicrobiales bacterium]|nr:formimidoylglutamate deiminase [Hyphomicrobiales bacterium]